MSQNKQTSSSRSPRGPRKQYTQFPLSRINTIMKSSPEVSNVSPEAVLLTAKAAVSHISRVNNQILCEKYFTGAVRWIPGKTRT